MSLYHTWSSWNNQVQGTVAFRSRCERSWNSCSTLSHRPDVALALGFSPIRLAKKTQSTQSTQYTFSGIRVVSECSLWFQGRGFIFRVVLGHPWPIALTCKLFDICWSMLTLQVAAKFFSHRSDLWHQHFLGCNQTFGDFQQLLPQGLQHWKRLWRDGRCQQDAPEVAGPMSSEQISYAKNEEFIKTWKCLKCIQ